MTPFGGTVTDSPSLKSVSFVSSEHPHANLNTTSPSSPGAHGRFFLMKRITVRVIWFLWGIVFFTFLAGAFVNLTGWWPSRWQVPWSGLGSFVETKDGIVLVDIKMWGRIELYDRVGKFLGSWRQPLAKGDLALATDETGAVYFRHANTIFKFDGNGEVQTKYVSRAAIPRNWRLSTLSGEPEYGPDQTGPIERQIVRRGQVLFSDDESQRFLCLDGTYLEQKHSSIIRVTSSGQTLATYKAPAYYWPVQFPFPGALAWVVGFVLVVLSTRKDKKTGVASGA